jgi:hypothetical protein
MSQSSQTVPNHQPGPHILCSHFFAQYNHNHHHAGIGLKAPDQIPFGQAASIHAASQTALDAAFPGMPEWFVHQRPKPAPNPDQGLDRPAKESGATPSVNSRNQPSQRR